MAKADYDEDYYNKIKQQFIEWKQSSAKVGQESSEHQIRKRADLLSTYNHIITFIGIVAGFGFTAIENVENISLFILGEAFFVGLFTFSIFYLKQFHITESDAFYEISEQLQNRFDTISKVYLDFFDKKLSRKNFEEKLSKTFSSITVPKAKPTKLDLNFLFNASLVLIILGGLFLLASFINFDNVIELSYESIAIGDCRFRFPIF